VQKRKFGGHGVVDFFIVHGITPRLMGDGVSRLICSAAMAIAPIRVPRSAPNQPNTPASDGRLIYRFFRLDVQKQ
jgi:hypothetical protein